jgi:hypothetical protein
MFNMGKEKVDSEKLFLITGDGGGGLLFCFSRPWWKASQSTADVPPT